jgi:hypothetical protein
LQFDVDVANFEIDVTIDDVLFNDIDIEIKNLHPNGIPWHGPREKGYIFLSILIWACCISNDIVVDLTIGTGIIQLHFQDPLGFFFFFVLLVFKSMISHSCAISRHFH